MKMSKVLLWRIFFFLFVFLGLLLLPGQWVVDTHDSGSQAAIEYWLLHHLRFGTDIHQNVGPYGFISYPATVTGYLDSLKIGLEVALVAALALFITIRSMRNPIKVSVIALVGFAFTKAFMHDGVLYYLAYLSVAAVFREPNILIQFLAVGILSVLANGKGPFAVVWLLTFTSCLAIAVIKRRPRMLAAAAAFPVAFFSMWSAIGQRVEDVPSYFSGVFTFSSGYNEAMIAIEPRIIAIFGALVALLLVGRILIVAWDGRSLESCLLALTQILIAFVCWKHAFVRADGHTYILFCFALLICIFGHWPVASGRSWMVKRAFLITTLIIALMGNYLARAEFGYGEKAFAIRALTNLRLILSFNNHLAALKTGMERASLEMQNEEFKRLVRDAPVTYVGHTPASIIYNEVNLKTIPSTISFASWNEDIVRADEAFLKNPELRYVMFTATSIDTRLTAADSPLVKLQLALNFKYRGEGRKHLYLERRSNRDVNLIPLTTIKLARNEVVTLPESQAAMTWMRVRFQSPLLERLMGVIYKPNVYHISIIFADGSVERFRLVPKLGRIGFIVDPFLQTNSDWTNFFTGKRSQRKAQSIQLSCTPIASDCANDFEIETSKVEVL